MRAVTYTRYGPPEVLRLADVPAPTPAADEVRIRVHATTVTSGDWRARGCAIPSKLFWLPGRLFFGLFRPRRQILGAELAGVVDAVGAGVTRFSVGDEVFGFPGGAFGGYAEFACMREGAALARKPARLSFGEAAALSFGGSTALFYLRDKADVQPGQRVLVYGASGGVGSAAVQVARALGAHVTGVCSGANAELVRSLGADEVIDYTREDFSARGEAWDVIFETVGKCPWSRARRALTPRGVFLAAVAGLPEVLGMPWTALRGGRRVVWGVAPERAEDLAALSELVEAGRLRAFIDRRYPLEQAAEAHRYVETGRKRGNVVLDVVPDAAGDVAADDASPTDAADEAR